MPCFHPLSAWYSKAWNAESGKRPVTFNLSEGFKERPISLPCGRCIGCRIERSRQWALRCVHEAKSWDSNCFVTLTYEDNPVSLVPRNFVLFMKRLRKQYGEGIRFFQCGEYGGKLGRPHHHALLFNHDFPDKRLHSRARGNALYVSKSLEDLWGHGFCTVGAVSIQSAGYIARYSLKKIYGPSAVEHYDGRVPEYLTMSRRPGIGRRFIDEFGSDVYPWDECITEGVRCKPPRYYDEVVSKLDVGMLKEVKLKRRIAGSVDPDGTGSRLIVREVVKQAQIAMLKRSVEES